MQPLLKLGGLQLTDLSKLCFVWIQWTKFIFQIYPRFLWKFCSSTVQKAYKNISYKRLVYYFICLYVGYNYIWFDFKTNSNSVLLTSFVKIIPFSSLPRRRCDGVERGRECKITPICAVGKGMWGWSRTALACILDCNSSFNPERVINQRFL